MRRPPPIVVLVGVALTLGIVLQVVPFYTDWLWFNEVGYTGVFWTSLSLQGGLFTAVAVGVLIFLWANLTLAARTAGQRVLGDPARLPQRPAVPHDRSGVRARSRILRVRAADVAARARLGHDAGGRHHAPDAGALRAPAQPRAHDPRSPSGRRRPDTPAGARGGVPGTQGGGVLARSLRDRVLDPGRHLRGLLYRHQRDAPGAVGAGRAGRGGRPRLPRADGPARPAPGRGRPGRARARLDRGARALPVGPA